MLFLCYESIEAERDGRSFLWTPTCKAGAFLGFCGEAARGMRVFQRPKNCPRVAGSAPRFASVEGLVRPARNFRKSRIPLTEPVKSASGAREV
jgi:hypothetical protein